MKLLRGKKQGMTQVFGDSGETRAATVIATAAAIELAVGDMVSVSGPAKGRGFQGVVKRHGFHGGSRTHGQKHSEREPGSIGGGLRTRVPKGMRMAGRVGGRRVSVKNLEVLAVNPEKNYLLISGATPGRRGTKVEIRSQNSKGKDS